MLHPPWASQPAFVAPFLQGFHKQVVDLDLEATAHCVLPELMLPSRVQIQESWSRLVEDGPPARPFDLYGRSGICIRLGALHDQRSYRTRERNVIAI